MIKYASIIVLSEKGNLVTVQKNRPDWQKGMYNFPGGHVEEGESFETAAIRELHEEANIVIDKEDITKVGIITDNNTFILNVYTITIPESVIRDQIWTMTDEPISIMPVGTFMELEFVQHTDKLLNAALDREYIELDLS